MAKVVFVGGLRLPVQHRKKVCLSCSEMHCFGDYVISPIQLLTDQLTRRENMRRTPNLKPRVPVQALKFQAEKNMQPVPASLFPSPEAGSLLFAVTEVLRE